VTALKLCLERVLAPRRDRPILFNLGRIARAADAVTALDEIIAAVAAGNITPQEGASIAELIQTLVRSIETADLEQRLVALETEAARCAH
jgi:hypothetical protein